ncbi:MAG: carbohydrate-binding family 9-like protein [Bryobacteraceae bacterium]
MSALRWLPLVCSLACAAADDWKPPVYTVHRATGRITIDGKLDEPAWFAAPDMGPLHFTWYKSGKKEQTAVKLLWDDEFLYVAHLSRDSHISAKHPEHDGNIPEDDCFEIMFAPDPDKPNVYFNVEWNVIGGYVDNFRPNGPKQPRAPKWDVEGLKIAGSYAGTLNDDSDTDQYWLVEVALPFRNFAQYSKSVPPQPGQSWNFNINRHGGKTDPQYSQWSSGDTPVPSFHTPHRFGRIVFSVSNPFGER